MELDQSKLAAVVSLIRLTAQRVQDLLAAKLQPEGLEGLATVCRLAFLLFMGGFFPFFSFFFFFFFFSIFATSSR